MPESGVRHPLIELSLVRACEFLRQGEAVFWVFGCPVLLTLALGIAFRNSGPEKILIGVEDNGAASAAIAEALRAAPDMKVSVLPPDDAARQLRTGKITLLVRPAQPEAGNGSGNGSVTYAYDATRPVRRVARL